MAKKEKFPVGTNVSIEQLKQVKQGKELVGVALCYHIAKYHTDCPTKITLTDMEPRMKLRVIEWVKKGRIYINN